MSTRQSLLEKSYSDIYDWIQNVQLEERFAQRNIREQITDQLSRHVVFQAEMQRKDAKVYQRSRDAHDKLATEKMKRELNIKGARVGGKNDRQLKSIYQGQLDRVRYQKSCRVEMYTIQCICQSTVFVISYYFALLYA